MKNFDLTTPVLIFCVILGMIGTYWLGYYISEQPEVRYPDKVENKTPVPVEYKEWPVEEGINPKG